MARSTKDRSFDILSSIGSSLDLLDELWDTNLLDQDRTFQSQINRILYELLCYSDFSAYLIDHKHLKSITNIPKLSPTHFVSNILYHHRCSWIILFCLEKLNCIVLCLLIFHFQSTLRFSQENFWNLQGFFT